MNSHYRLWDCWNEDGTVQIVVERFDILKETKAGYWVLSHYKCGDVSQKRWTPKLGPRYCHPTMEDAILHYSLRKQWEQRHLKHRLDKNRTVLANIENLIGAVLDKEGQQTFALEFF